jgi:hypothetical protein
MFKTVIRFSLLVILLSFIPRAMSAPCEDNASFQFGSYEFRKVVTIKTCKWLTITPIKSRTRMEEWCNGYWNGENVGQQCAKTCNKCLTNTQTKPKPKTNKKAKTDPSCKDDKNFRFGSYMFNGYSEVMDCEWLTETNILSEKRKKKWCNNKYYQGINIGNRCADTCNKCPKDDTLTNPVSNNDDSCKNDSSFSFGTYEYNGSEYTRTCEWMKETPSKEWARKATWCGKTYDRKYAISKKCPEVCDKNCPRRGRARKNLRQRSL